LFFLISGFLPYLGYSDMVKQVREIKAEYYMGISKYFLNIL
jgi:hypothetical protein